MESVFRHRWNKDQTVDSICTVCFLTVGRAPSLNLLRAEEDSHQCPGPPPLAPKLPIAIFK